MMPRRVTGMAAPGAILHHRAHRVLTRFERSIRGRRTREPASRWWRGAIWRPF